MGQILEPQFEGEIMKLPDGSMVDETTPSSKASPGSVWIVAFFIAALVLGGGGWFMWSQWEALTAPITVPTIAPEPVVTPATSTPGIPDFIPPPSDSTEVEDIVNDLDNTPIDTLDTEFETLDHTIYELTTSTQP